MSCKQPGGACEKEFHSNTFEEIAEMSQLRGMKMFQNQDKDHLEAMNKIQAIMKQPETMKEWFETKKKEFEALSEN